MYILYIHKNPIHFQGLKHLEEWESPALGHRKTWDNRLFSKSMKGKILNFLEVEKMISAISVEV